MCHGAAVRSFPSPTRDEPFEGLVHGFRFGDPAATNHIAVLPDIYGCNPFYRGLSERFAQRGARVSLVDPFYGLGDLPEVTREAAFARRHKVQDKKFIEQFEQFCVVERVTGVIGFCLGGLYVFELARRDLPVALVGLYGFPQGMPNADPLPVPFDYLAHVARSFTMLMGAQDISVGPDIVARLSAISPSAPAMDLTVYENAGHGFLPLIDSEDPLERDVAVDALRRIDALLLSTVER
ncbi:dienelactone hydrolase family protein [Bradyrhizobium yuanmingense]|uniref:dienelactone hydrolase family protein n=1 Tax=Bradyrhizobium yuanmingense TaxID=108015 RepID=UPI0009D9180B|nr:dienelactone hydrolase family protein [Bradyrhizobium yuanmingense]